MTWEQLGYLFAALIWGGLVLVYWRISKLVSVCNLIAAISCFTVAIANHPPQAHLAPMIVIDVVTAILFLFVSWLIYWVWLLRGERNTVQTRLEYQAHLMQLNLMERDELIIRLVHEVHEAKASNPVDESLLEEAKKIVEPSGIVTTLRHSQVDGNNGRN